MPPRHEPRCSGGVSEIGTLLWRLLEASGYNDLRVTYDSGGDRVFVSSRLPYNL